MVNQKSYILIAMNIMGFLFLYIPIILLVIYSFNESKLVTVWSGFSTKWYGELLKDPQILGAAWISLKIAFISATASLILGTLTAIALVRFGAFKGRYLLTLMSTAPLVMPEVITGLSLLLLFVSLETAFGWPGGRDIYTIIIAHTSFGLAYVAVIIQSRIIKMEPFVEDAAQDLGAKPIRVFFDITLPIIAPSMVAAWLLAFTLSLDDLVIASFVSGPGSSTLPMVVFSKVRLGVTPEINALATLIILFIFISTIIIAFNIRSKKVS